MPFAEHFILFLYSICILPLDTARSELWPTVLSDGVGARGRCLSCDICRAGSDGCFAHIEKKSASEREGKGKMRVVARSWMCLLSDVKDEVG
jgi:hypothetical protein